MMTKEEIISASEKTYPFPGFPDMNVDLLRTSFMTGAQYVLSQQAKDKEELKKKYINHYYRSSPHVCEDIWSFFEPHLNTQKEDWIKLTDDTEPDGEVLAIGYQNCHLIGYIGGSDEEGWQCENDNELLKDVTHWMPLPKPPDII